MKKCMQGLLALLMLFGMNVEAARSHSAKKDELSTKMVVKKMSVTSSSNKKSGYKTSKKSSAKVTSPSGHKDQNKQQQAQVKRVRAEVNKEAHKAAAAALRAKAEQGLKGLGKLQDEIDKTMKQAREIDKNWNKHKTKAELERVKRVAERLYKEERELRSASQGALYEAKEVAKERQDLLGIESKLVADLEEKAQELKDKKREVNSQAREDIKKMKDACKKAGLKSDDSHCTVHHSNNSAEKKAEEKKKKKQDKARHERRVARARAQQRRDDARHKVGDHKYHRPHRDVTAQDLKDGSVNMSMKKHSSKRAGRMSHR